MTPLIYTSSPFEAHVIATFMKAQTAMASFFHGTPVFRGLLFAALTWAVLQQFLKIATDRHSVGHALVTIGYRLGMVFLAIGLLSWATTGVTLSSVDRPWASYSAVAGDPQYADTLNGQTRSLWAYTLVYQAIDGVAQTSVNAAAQAFEDDTLGRDPTFLVEQLERMESFTFSPPTQSAWEALTAACGKQDDPEVPLNPNAPIQALFDLNAAECQTLWSNFESSARADGAALVAAYPQSVRDNLLAVLRVKVPEIGQDELAQIATAYAFRNMVRDFVAVGKASAESSKESGGASGPVAEDAPKEDTRNKVNHTILQIIGDEGQPESLGFDRLKDQLAMVLPLIPTARGYIEGILAMLFVLAAYSVGFGTWKYLMMWCMAQISVCFYKPVALLGYKVTEYFMQDTLRDQMIAMSTNGLVLGGAGVMRQQLSNIGAIYVAFELGAFITFCVGAIALFRPLANLAYGGYRPQGAGGAPNAFGGGRHDASMQQGPITSASTTQHTNTVAALGLPRNEGSLPEPLPGGATGLHPSGPVGPDNFSQLT